MKRLDVLRDLVLFSKPVKDLTTDLSQFSWDYEGEPLIIEASQIKEIILRYINGDFSALELEDWANLIEGREDLEYESDYQEKIETVIYCIANPSLEGAISPPSCKALLNSLD